MDSFVLIRVIAAWADMVVPPILAALIWWRLAKLRKQAFKAEFTTVVVSAAAMVLALYTATKIESEGRFGPFNEFYVYYFFLLIILGGVFIYLYQFIFASRKHIIFEVLFAATYSWATFALGIFTPLGSLPESMMSLASMLAWATGLVFCAVPFIALAAFIYTLRNQSKKVTPHAASISMSALLFMAIVYSAWTVQTQFEALVPPRLAAQSWLLKMDFGTRLSPQKLQDLILANRRAWHEDEAKMRLLAPVLGTGFRPITEAENPRLYYMPHEAGFTDGNTQVLITSGSISIWDAIVWLSESPQGLPVEGLASPVSQEAFTRKYGRGDAEPRALWTADTFIFTGAASDEHRMINSSLSYSTGSLGLDTLALYFDSGRLVAAEYYPKHHDVIAPWEMPLLLSVSDAFTGQNTFALVIILLPLAFYICARLYERRRTA